MENPPLKKHNLQQTQTLTNTSQRRALRRDLRVRARVPKLSIAPLSAIASLD